MVMKIWIEEVWVNDAPERFVLTSISVNLSMYQPTYEPVWCQYIPGKVEVRLT